MITEKQIDALVERLLENVNKANNLFLENIGASIKKLSKLSPTKAQQLIQILKYGGNYDEIIKQLSRILNMNIYEVDRIFNAYAKYDYAFYEQFYKYRNLPYIPYANNIALVNQTNALANIVKNELYDFARINVLGYSFRDINGNITFMGLKDTYTNLLDRAFVLVGQGKETFDSAMKDILQDIGGSGLRTIDYESGRSVRLDSVVKMHLKSRLRELHNENQKLIANDIDADGIEISVHEAPAPDHEEAQGRQFSKSEFEKLQTTGTATDVTGRVIDMHRELKMGGITTDYRPISELNCYHYVFAIVLGVSKPSYTDKQLQTIIDNNNAGFDLDGKHYTNYEGTQLQRRIETEIRKQKDIKALGVASDNQIVVSNANSKITALRTKYKQITEASGLKPKPKRMRV